MPAQRGTHAVSSSPAGTADPETVILDTGRRSLPSSLRSSMSSVNGRLRADAALASSEAKAASSASSLHSIASNPTDSLRASADADLSLNLVGAPMATCPLSTSTVSVQGGFTSPTRDAPVAGQAKPLLDPTPPSAGSRSTSTLMQHASRASIASACQLFSNPRRRSQSLQARASPPSPHAGSSSSGSAA
eukprot:3777519-Rhodomonas_salina.1